jgi:hypothetical protein
MKKLLVTAIVLAVTASVALAQQTDERIGLFSDIGGTDCTITDQVPGLVAIYAVNINTNGTTACQFRATAPACIGTGSWLSDTAVFPVTVNNSQVGVAVGYGTCQVAPIHVLTINFFLQGTSDTCCVYPVTPDPSVPSGEIEFVDCLNNLLFGKGQSGMINAFRPECACDQFSVPAENTSWGRIKEMYRGE